MTRDEFVTLLKSEPDNNISDEARMYGIVFNNDPIGIVDTSGKKIFYVRDFTTSEQVSILYDLVHNASLYKPSYCSFFIEGLLYSLPDPRYTANIPSLFNILFYGTRYGR